ncbi:MAG: peptidyl-prolyl cis-trans isomerase [Herminiimonas sp.]|nr:peptidyl-prolyl cis-trans isomerase [Herminiimonas sp.]
MSFLLASRRRIGSALVASACALVFLPLSPITMAAGPASAPHVALKTSAGEIILELNPTLAPKTVDNFLQYIKSGQYDGTVFHRVIDGFMIQGGGMDKDLREKPTRPPIRNEASNGLKNEAYTVAMARTGDPDSATAQFFINVGDNAALDYPKPDGAGYAVFGKVVKGKEVVDQIRKAATGSKGPYQDVPLKPITITTARLLP